MIYSDWLKRFLFASVGMYGKPMANRTNVVIEEFETLIQTGRLYELLINISSEFIYDVIANCDLYICCRVTSSTSLIAGRLVRYPDVAFYYRLSE